MPEPRRTCTKCSKSRAMRFFASHRGRVCLTCQRDSRRRSGRTRHLLETYNLTHEEYDALYEAQGGRCAICGGTRGYMLHVDHDHAAERNHVPIKQCIRGLLCKTCNKRLLPAARDSVDTLQRAVSYLLGPPAKRVLSSR